MEETIAYLTNYTKDRENAYFVLDGKEIILKPSISIEEKTFVKGFVENNIFNITHYWKPSKEELLTFMAQTEQKIEIFKPPLFKSIEKAARKIKTAKLFRRQCLIRFHNDADGIVSCFLISQAINAIKIPQHSAIYSVKEALNDIPRLKYGELPLCIFLDFGCSKECKDAYEILKADEIEIMIIDHHPVDEEIKELAFIVNPLLENFTAEHTTGYLCKEILDVLGITSYYNYRISLAGDKSSFPYDENDKKIALALDYAAFHVNPQNALDIYHEILKNENFAISLANKAEEAIQESVEEMKKKAKKFLINNIAFYYLDTEQEEKSFPPSGKIATYFAETIEEPALVAGCSSNFCSFRLSKSAKEKDLINLNDFVKSLKEKSSIIESGGGHKFAASIKIKDKNLVLPLILETLKDFLNKTL